MRQLPHELARLGCQRALVVCGTSIARGGLQRVRDALDGCCVGAFDRVQAHSPEPLVQDAAKLLAELQADAVIAVGGGSAAVTARGAVILQAEGRPATLLCTQRGADGRVLSPRLDAPKLPVFVVPTTPTTACVKAGSALHDPVSGRRLALYDPKTRAKSIFVDPQLLRAAPVDLVRSASLNALAMAVEGLESAQSDALADSAMMHALRLIADHLPRLAGGPDDDACRVQLVLAAVLCGQGTDHAGGGLASVLGHAIGPRCHAANGVVSAVVLPHTMRFNASATASRLHKVAAALGSAASTATDAASAAIAAVKDLLSQLPVPQRLRELGVPRAAFGDIAATAMDDWFLQRNPVSVQNAGELLPLLDAAW